MGVHRGGDIGVAGQVELLVEIRDQRPPLGLAVELVVLHAGLQLARRHRGGDIGIVRQVDLFGTKHVAVSMEISRPLVDESVI